MPVLLISTYDDDGNTDCMTAAWATMEDNDVILIELSKDHVTTKNILKRKAFVVSVCDKENTARADFVGIVSEKDDKDKFKKTGWSSVPATSVDAPILPELKLALECELRKVRDEEDEFVVYGKIKNVSIDDSILDEEGHIDFLKAGFITYNSADQSYRIASEKTGDAFRDGLKLK